MREFRIGDCVRATNQHSVCGEGVVVSLEGMNQARHAYNQSPSIEQEVNPRTYVCVDFHVATNHYHRAFFMAKDDLVLVCPAQRVLLCRNELTLEEI